MNNPLISIIVPVYNVEKYLDRCLNSIVNQTYQNLEIILVDDGSPDNCPQMCDEWAKKDSRINVIHKSNEGVFCARNIGIENSNGEYISFVDSDDWLEKDALEYLLNLADDKYLIASVNSASVFENEAFNTASATDEIIEHLDFDDAVKGFANGICYLWGKLFHKSLFEDLPKLPKGLIVSEDAMTVFLLLKKANAMVRSNQQKYFYFRHSGSIMQGCITDKMINDSMLAYKTMLSFLEPNTKVYDYQLYNQIKSDFFLINSVIRNKTCKNFYENLKNDIISCYSKINDESVISKKHKISIQLIKISPHLYNSTILLRKLVRGY
ncbi:MAG: glycosyltransferase family 2 protein [Eubacterium sp.]